MFWAGLSVAWSIRPGRMMNRWEKVKVMGIDQSRTDVRPMCCPIVGIQMINQINQWCGAMMLDCPFVPSLITSVTCMVSMKGHLVVCKNSWLWHIRRKESQFSGKPTTWRHTRITSSNIQVTKTTTETELIKGSVYGNGNGDNSLC